ncbi:MAG: hypothetical protein U0V72_10225 [Cytophagales bacterium]
MYKYLFHIFLFFTICSNYNTYAQTHIIVKNQESVSSGKGIIRIKWFSEKLLQEKPVYVYRKEKGTEKWVLVSSKPMTVGASIPAAFKAKDSELQMYEDLIKNRKSKPIVGILMLSLWVKAIQSDPFAQYLGITHTNTTAKVGEVYQYALKAYEHAEADNLIISSEIKCTGKSESIAKAENVSFVAEKKSVGIDWKQENLRFWAVNVYKRHSKDSAFVWVGGAPTMANLQEKNKPEAFKHIATDDKVKEGGLYFYKLAPVDFFGVEGQMSAVFPVFVKDNSAPQKPVLRKDTLKNQHIRLYWSIPKDADLKGFHVYKSIGNNENFIKVTKTAIPKSEPFFSEKLAQANDYYYFVTSVDTADNESPSNTIIANIEDITPPAVPSHLKAKSDSGKIMLSWKSNTETDLWGYKIYRGLKGQSLEQFVLLTNSPIKNNAYTDVINKASTNTFIYALTAVDSSYNQSEKSDSVRVTLLDLVPPVAPYIKDVVMQADGYLKMVWLAPSEYDLQGFDVYLKNKETPTYEKLNEKYLAASVREFSFKLPPSYSTDCELRIKSIDIHKNESEFSEKFMVHVPTVKNINTNEAQKISLKGSYNKKKKYVDLKWKAKNEEGLSKYMVFMKTKSGEFKPVSQFMTLNQFGYKVLESQNSSSWQIRAYLPNGIMYKSDILELKH